MGGDCTLYTIIWSFSSHFYSLDRAQRDASVNHCLRQLLRSGESKRNQLLEEVVVVVVSSQALQKSLLTLKIYLLSEWNEMLILN